MKQKYLIALKYLIMLILKKMMHREPPKHNPPLINMTSNATLQYSDKTQKLQTLLIGLADSLNWQGITT